MRERHNCQKNALTLIRPLPHGPDRSEGIMFALLNTPPPAGDPSTRKKIQKKKRPPRVSGSGLKIEPCASKPPRSP